MCVCLCQYYTVLITVALKYSLKSGSMIPSLIFFLKIALAIQGLLWFQMNFRVFKNFCRKGHWNFDSDCIESIDGFGLYGHFNNMNSSQYTFYKYSMLNVFFVKILSL